MPLKVKVKISAEQESLIECLRIMYGVTVQMQMACHGIEGRMPSLDCPIFERETTLRGFSMIYVECQRLLEEAATCMAAELKNVRIPKAPTLN